MYEIAVKNAQSFYTRLSTQPFTPEKVKMLFSTGHTVDLSHPFPNEYSISGCTTYHDESPASLVSEVELVFNISGFNWDTHLACLYVLFHECVSHAYQGMLLQHATRRATEPRDSFAEGWMDWISLKVLEAALLADSVSVINLGQSCDEVAKVADTYHRSRLSFEHFKQEKHKKDSVHWNVGVRAAQKFYKLLGILPETKESQEDLFLQISFDLNLLECDMHKLEIFVWNIDDYLAAEGRLPSPCQLYTIADIIRIYLKTKNIIGFMQMVIDLPPLRDFKKLFT